MSDRQSTTTPDSHSVTASDTWLYEPRKYNYQHEKFLHELFLTWDLRCTYFRSDNLHRWLSREGRCALFSGIPNSVRWHHAPLWRAFFLQYQKVFGSRKIYVYFGQVALVMKVAERVAAERKEHVGKAVGFCIGGEQHRSRDTPLTYCTTGYMLQVGMWAPFS